LDKNRNLAVLSFTVFIILLTLFSWYYLFPLFLEENGATEDTIGVLYSIFGLGFTLAQVMGGYMSDKMGRKPLIVFPTFSFPLFYLILALSKRWITSAICYLIPNIASAVQMPSFTSMIAESEEKLGKSFGFFEFTVTLGIAIGPLLGAFILRYTGIRLLIALTSATTLIAALLRMRYLKETLKRENRVTFNTSNSEPLSRNFLFYLAFGCLTFFVFSLSIFGPFLTLFMKDVLLYTKARINTLVSFGWLIGAFLSPFAGMLSDRLGAKRILGVSVILHPVLLFLWTIVKAPFFLILSIPFAQFVYITYQVIISEITEETTRARLIGLFGTVTGLVSATGPYIGMKIRLNLGDPVLFLMASIIAVVSVMFLGYVKIKK